MADEVHLYSVTLKAASDMYGAAGGSFSGERQHEVAVALGCGSLALLSVADGRVTELGVSPTFGRVRALAAFRLMGASRDHLVVASDSGRVAILSWEGGSWSAVHLETYGRSGLRRTVPGQWLAVDPRGRAFMLGAVEKSKLVYILNRDSEQQLTISSPLEAHRAHSVVFDATGLDVGYDNPVFAVLESEAAGQRSVVRYELDMGLNHIVRRGARPVHPRAHRLASVPGGGEGPGNTCLPWLYSYFFILYSYSFFL